MSSALNIIGELLRQKATGDNRYLGYYTYFFELEVPPETAILGGVLGNKFLYPLVVGPQAYSITEPFALKTEVGQGGSLFAEENGVVERTIKLSGHTGFAPRDLQGYIPASLLALPADKRSYSRKLPVVDVIAQDLSGHAHFMYLEDAVFRTYGDLKKDPSTAEKTKMYFHNFKDDEHWLVAPKSFSLARTSSQRTLYPYSIELVVLDRADAPKLKDTSTLLDKIKDVIAMVAMAVDMIEGAINDIIALVDDIKRFVKGIIALIDTVANIIRAVKDFINGVTDLIKVPLAVLASVRNVIDAAMETVDAFENLKNAPGEVKKAFDGFPDTARQLLRQVGDGMDILGMHPSAFATPAQMQMEAFVAKASATKSVGTTALDAAAAAPGPKTFAQLKRLGTGLLPGDAQRARAQDTAGLPGQLPNYKSTFEVSVTKGDTLASLAARYLGSESLWRHIAIINGMKPPFLNDQAAANASLTSVPALSGVLGTGMKIRIPSFAPPPQRRDDLPILGVRLDAPNEEQMLGTDLLLQPVNSSERRGRRPLYDWVVDTSNGSVDGKKVRGMSNLKQGMISRLSTEIGTDVLFPDLGVERVIGSAGTTEKLLMAKFRILEAVNKDPRVSSAKNLVVTPLVEQPDLVEVEIEADVKGFSQGTGIRAVV